MEKNHWQIEQTPLEMSLNQMQKQLRDMFKETGAEPTYSMAQIVEQLKAYGASVGADDVITAAAYGAAGISGHAAAGAMAVNNVNALARELYSEAVEKFGTKIVHSKKANDLARMQNFLKGHPKYGQLMQHLKALPKHLLPKGHFTPFNINSNVAAARHFRKHVSLPLNKWHNSSRYVSSMARQLNGRLSFLQGVGRHATWYVPAALGVISVASAPPELKMRRLFEEGFGIIGGALGTMLGSTVVASSVIGLMTFCGLCLGPLGAFIVVFVFASAGGIIGMNTFKKFGSGIYEYVIAEGSGRIYRSPEEVLLGGIK